MPYISITGLKLKKKRYALRFWWHAFRSMHQARKATWNRGADARIVAGVHHTLSVWDDEPAMRRFLTEGAHLAALKAFRSIATGRTFGYVSDQVPSLDEIHQIWNEKARAV